MTSKLYPPAGSGQFDSGIYAAALAYYGLPADYARVFTLRPLPSEPPATAHRPSMLVACNAAVESRRGQAVWVQLNPPRAGAALTRWGRPRKASNWEIACLANVSLDFEYPSEPKLAHAVGEALAAFLMEEGLAAPGLPVEDSGAGCHLVLPLPALPITEQTASQWNRAVHHVVRTLIKPRFDHLVRQAGIKMELEGFDISRLLSVPGTWRPSNPAKADSPTLRPGTLRRWLPPYSHSYPIRQECALLAHQIKAAYQELEQQPGVHSPPRPGPTPDGDAAAWLRGYAARKANADRSALFQALVSGLYLKYGEATVLALQEDIDQLSGEKYAHRLEREIQRSLAVARRGSRAPVCAS
jgi:hypothetical protein